MSFTSHATHTFGFLRSARFLFPAEPTEDYVKAVLFENSNENVSVAVTKGKLSNPWETAAYTVLTEAFAQMITNDRMEKKTNSRSFQEISKFKSQRSNAARSNPNN